MRFMFVPLSMLEVPQMLYPLAAGFRNFRRLTADGLFSMQCLVIWLVLEADARAEVRIYEPELSTLISPRKLKRPSLACR
jgi:hypothetical protein